MDTVQLKGNYYGPAEGACGRKQEPTKRTVSQCLRNAEENAPDYNTSVHTHRDDGLTKGPAKTQTASVIKDF